MAQAGEVSVLRVAKRFGIVKTKNAFGKSESLFCFFPRGALHFRARSAGFYISRARRGVLRCGETRHCALFGDEFVEDGGLFFELVGVEL